MIGFYLEKYNFSVRKHNGQWCMFARLLEDQLATTDEQIAAVEMWAASNREKFMNL